MKALLGILTLCLGLVGCAGVSANTGSPETDAQSVGDIHGNVKKSNDPFDGAWKVDWSKSRYIDELKSRKSSPKSAGPHGVKEEVVTLTIANNAEHCINDLTFEDGTRSRSEYTATYNDGKWYPTKNLMTGRVGTGAVMMIRIEPGREMRISRNAEGKVEGVVLRTVLEDGSMRTMNLDFDRLYTEGTRRTDITLIKQ